MRFMQFRAHDKYALHLSKMEKVGAILLKKDTFCFTYIVVWFTAREGAGIPYILHVSFAFCGGCRLQCLYARYATLSGVCQGLRDHLCATPSGHRSSTGQWFSNLGEYQLILIENHDSSKCGLSCALQRWKLPRTTCGSGRMAGSIRSSARRPAKFRLVFIGHKTRRAWTRHMWVIRP